jgi:F-type H+-transporting ATPase subunit gamma
MPSLKEVRTRIASVKSTQQITSAMKMVAASKLRKAQTGILQLRPYAGQQQKMLRQLSAGQGEALSAFNVQRDANRVLYVVFTSNRGLCGAYNTNVIKQVNSLLAAVEATKEEAALITIGRKATEFYAKMPVNIVASYDELYDQLNYPKSAEVAESLMELFLSGAYDRIVFVYHQFKNAVVQKLQVEQFLPVQNGNDEPGHHDHETEYIFDPSRQEILTELIPRILKTQFFKALLDAWASELGARMTAMSQATDNASELLKELRLTYNKARQAAITKEILEIVGGAEALKNA